MCELAAHLVEGVFGDVPVRQWVLTLPHRLRCKLAYDHALCRTVLAVFVRALLAFERRRARAHGIIGRGGAVTAIQRCGSALNTNLHVIATDGGTIGFSDSPTKTVEPAYAQSGLRLPARWDLIANSADNSGRLEALMVHHRRIALACIPATNDFGGSPDMYPSYGIRRVQAALLSDPELAKTTVELFEFDGSDPQQAAARLVDFDPAIVGFSAYMWSFPALLAIARFVKQALPTCKVVFGGPSARPSMFSLKPFADSLTFVDAIALGEGEDLMCEIASLPDLDDASLAQVRGIAVPTERGWRETGPRPEIDPLDRLVSPYELGIMPRDAANTGYIETYRGCPMACKFCEWGVLKDAKRVFSKEYLAHELRLLSDYDVFGAFHLDAGLNLNKRGFENLRDAEAEVGFFREHTLACEVYPTHMSNEQYAFLERCRTVYIGVGLQSFDAEVLRRVGRPFHERHFDKVIERLAGIAPVEVHLIMGLPGDTPEGFLRTFEKARQLPADLRVYPCLVLPDALMTRSDPDFNIQFDPYSLKMTSCLGWSEQALRDTWNYVVELACKGTSHPIIPQQSLHGEAMLATTYWTSFPLARSDRRHSPVAFNRLESISPASSI